jgi:hypothetical protein
MKKILVFSFLVSVLFYFPVSFAQTEVDPAEITSSVPELSDFHEIIYPMWHEAYPSKDYEALKGYVPQIKTSIELINNAKLPGILRDRETEWKEQLDELNLAGQNYYDAVNKNDNEALLKAAENLHSAYERMVRVIRPVLKEIDDFHQSLYVIYHKLYPDGKYDEIAGMTGELVTRVEAIMNYPKDRLKQRLGDNIDKYDSAAKQLYSSILALKEALDGNDPNKKNDAVESMHRAYQELEGVFH